MEINEERLQIFRILFQNLEKVQIVLRQDRDSILIQLGLEIMKFQEVSEDKLCSLT